ncbi:lasso peptide biosynthesis PqqD family chaperone [Streptomyces sp. RP5T]|uniref:lasso peptide biosynthesis PqqD family chaperone n=1 Tax=Streptomyces sp. RP5T TaxID=2490848 RepID=UPI000F64981D|nr:lasso peptide biosynthesis PqqD family chaperone [Streptomyces sp. RP5T]RRR78969.1 lasso peptide biosynthesis PqqD family chaperone [Streptomyces sp. RP5T]
MTYTLEPEVIATDVDDGVVLLDQRTGRYFQLNRSGATTLRLLLDGNSPDRAAESLAAGRSEDLGRARTDVRALLASLLKAKLVVSS